MAPYWLILLFACVLGFLVCELDLLFTPLESLVRGRDEKSWTKPLLTALGRMRKQDFFFIVLLTAAMAAMALVRAASVGVDTKMYMEYFSAMGEKSAAFLFSGDNVYLKEPGYGLLNFLLSRFALDPRQFVGIVSALIIILRMAFVCRHSASPWLSVAVFISFNFFGYALCTLRQELAISIAFFALPYLEKRKPAPCVLLIVLAAAFHASAWLLLPAFLLALLPLNKLMLGIYAGGTLFLLMFSEPIMGFVTRYVYKNYEPGSYYMQGRDYSTAVFPVTLFILAMLLSKKLLARRKANMILINFSCYAAFLFVLTLKHFVFQRIALLFLPAALLLIPEILRCVSPNEEKRLELARLNGLGKARQKQNRDKIAALKLELKNEMALYYTSMGLILAGGAVYFLFLLSANRLMLVPYLPFWMAAG